MRRVKLVVHFPTVIKAKGEKNHDALGRGQSDEEALRKRVERGEVCLDSLGVGVALEHADCLLILGRRMVPGV